MHRALEAGRRGIGYNVRVIRIAAAALCVLALVPAASASREAALKPLLGIKGNADRFQSLTGQHSTVGYVIVGWEQGATWGSPFVKLFGTMEIGRAHV